MQEAERFLRYVIPGVTFSVELLIYLLISRDICFSQLIGLANPIGTAFSGFLASGSLGFLFGAFYYTVVWSEKMEKIWKKIGLKGGADLSRFLVQAESRKWLKLYCPGTGEVSPDKLTKRGTWRTVVSYLNTRLEASKQIKGAIRIIDRLAGLANGLGTTCLASLGAFVVFLLIHNLTNGSLSLSWHLDLSLMFGIAILILHYYNYKGVVEDYENVVGAILLNEFEHEWDENKNTTRIKLYVSQNDLKTDCLNTESQSSHE